MLFVESTTETEEMRELSKHLGTRQNQTTTMADLAYLLFFMGDYSRTISFCQKLLSEVRDSWSLTIRCYSTMGQAYENHPELALQSFENALELQLQYNPSDYNSLATMYNNMGWIHRRLESDVQVVVNYYERALQMCTSVSDKNEMEWCLMATILNNLVTTRPHGQGDLALERERTVLDIRLKYLPLSHPLVAATHIVLAQIYSERGEYEDALIHYEEALRLRHKYLPNGHSSIVSVYHDIGLHNLYKGDHEMNAGYHTASRTSYKKSLKFSSDAFDFLLSSESSISTNYKLICLCINTCGVICARLNRFDEAIKYFGLLINTIKQHLPIDHSLHAAFLRNRGSIFTLHGDMNRGMEYYECAVKFCDQIGLENSAEKAQVYLNIGEWYELSGQRDLAIEYYQHAIQLGTEYLGKGHPLLLWCAKGLKRMNSIAAMLPEQVSWL
ncbi:hypothetical protein I4U23_005432 [Adineta vaga]|nr:hypothetical protein I4U23_005432 [Adineta vaga]